MPAMLNVYALPQFLEPHDLVGGTAVVIDVLRSTTSIVHALAAGAREVIPCAELDDARAMAAQFEPGEALLGGERRGLPIAGFDLGNSPAEYSSPCVAGKSVVITTTNGTRAMAQARSAAQILIGAFVNISALKTRLLDEEQIHIICSGTDGCYSEDDVLLAGMLVERLDRSGSRAYQMNAQALTAREYWLRAFALPQALGAEPLVAERLAAVLRTTAGGRNLVALGLEADILAAARIDRFSLVPELDLTTGRITRGALPNSLE